MGTSCKWNVLKIFDTRESLGRAGYLLKECSGDKAKFLRKKYKKLLDIDKDIIIETDEEFQDIKQTLENIGL